jgi:hypothetical protein
VEHACTLPRWRFKQSTAVAVCIVAGFGWFGPSFVWGSEDLSVRASPSVSVDPGRVTIVVRHVPRADDRALTIEIDSPSRLQSSYIDLEGTDAPSAHQVEFRNLPSGSYVVRAFISRNGEDSEYVHTYFRVLGTTDLSSQ